MLAEAGARVEQELVHRVASGQRRFERVAEARAEQAQRALRDGHVGGGRGSAGVGAPLPPHREGARVEARRQFQRSLAQHVAELRLEARRRGGSHPPAGERGERPRAVERIVERQPRARGREARQFERDQLAVVGRLDFHLVVPVRRAGFDRRRRDVAQPARLGPAPAVVVPQHRSAPVHLRGPRRGAEELHAQRGGVVVHQVEPFARRHVAREAGPRHRAFGHAPHRAGDAREQPEGRQRQRQADGGQAADAAQPAQRRQRARVAGVEFRDPQQCGERERRADQAEHQRQRPLVEQEGGEWREQREPEQAAGVAHARGFRGLDR